MLHLITNNIIGCLTLTLICSLTAIAIWDILIAIFKEKKKFGLIFGWMWMALIFTSIPVMYLLDKVKYLPLIFDKSTALEIGHQMWYTYHDNFVKVISILLIVWLLGIIVKTGWFWIQKRQVDRMVALRDKVKDERVLEWFYRVKKEIGIRRSVTLYENQIIQSPVTMTWGKQAVMIPKRYYTDKELYIMFYHELLHIKNGDRIKKKLVILADCLFWFNPLMNHFKIRLIRWSETECDYKAVKLLEGVVTVGEYFTILLEIVQHSGRENMWLISSASGSKEEWERRFRLIDGSLNVRQMKNIVSVASVVLLMGLMSSTAYGATLQLDQWNAELAMSDRAREVEEVNTTETYEETTEYLTQEEMNTIIVDDSVVIPEADGQRGLSNVSWTINAGSKLRGAYVYLRQGDTVGMAGFLSPDDVQIKAGILCSDGSLTTIRATNQFVHTFNISWNGMYAIYVENMGTETVTVDIAIN